MRDSLVEPAQGEIDVGSGHEFAGKCGGEFGAKAVGFEELALGAGVESAKRRMIGLTEHAASAAIGKRELAKGGFEAGTGTGAFWFIHGFFLRSEFG